MIFSNVIMYVKFQLLTCSSSIQFPNLSMSCKRITNPLLDIKFRYWLFGKRVSATELPLRPKESCLAQSVPMRYMIIRIICMYCVKMMILYCFAEMLLDRFIPAQLPGRLDQFEKYPKTSRLLFTGEPATTGSIWLAGSFVCNRNSHVPCITWGSECFGWTAFFT